MTLRRLLGGLDRRAQGGWQEVEAAGGADAHLALVHQGIGRQVGELVLDGGEYSRNFLRRPLQVLGRAYPERHRWDAKGGAPVQEVVELGCSHRVAPVGIGDLPASSEQLARKSVVEGNSE